ncbi:MAG: endonuclease/exonuclease/phosphatase family protein [Chloroflexota bacterium]
MLQSPRMTHMKESSRIIFWNIRAGGGKRIDGIADQLLAWQPDIIGLSEFRGTPASQALAERLRESGFLHQIQTVNPCELAKNALLLASRFPMSTVKSKHMPTLRERWILAKVAAPSPLTVGLMHVPNYTHPTLKYPFLEAVLKMSGNWRRGPAILGGDTNCGKRNIDEEKPMSGGFQREHDFIVGMEERGWADAFRSLHGDRREYTWYSHRNNGFRLDYAFLSPALTPQLSATRHEWGIDPTQPGRRDGLSDHAALIVDIASPPAIS